MHMSPKEIRDQFLSIYDGQFAKEEADYAVTSKNILL